MKLNNAGKNELDIESIKRLIQKAGIYYGPFIILFMEDIKDFNIDTRALWAAFIAITINGIKKYLTDYSK